MGFVRSPIGLFLLALGAVTALAVAGTSVLVHRVTTPERHRGAEVDFDSVLMRVEDVRFKTSDGVELAGWLLPGRPDLPPLVLCHDLGSSKGALINLAIALRGAGFSVLLFDFRGHGDSSGTRSTLGLREKRDVIAALDFLASDGGSGIRAIGIFGAGMGAYAAVLAAVERPELKALVLDALYPDISYMLVRRAYPEWSGLGGRAAFLPRGVFSVMSGESLSGDGIGEVIGELSDRDVLLLAPAGDSALTREMQRMYETIPTQSDTDSNLVVLPATLGDGLFGEQLTRYHEHVTAFLESRLGRG